MGECLCRYNSFQRSCWISKARGRQDVARGMFVDTSRDRQQLTVFFNCEEVSLDYGGGEGGGEWGDLM